MSSPTRFSLLSLTLLVACAGGTRGGSQTPRPRSAGVLTGAEMREAGFRDAYEALVALRPEILFRARDAVADNHAPVEPVVYIDDQVAGGLETLRQISTSWVASIRLIKMSTPEPQFMSGVRTGAIVVRTVKPGPAGR